MLLFYGSCSRSCLLFFFNSVKYNFGIYKLPILFLFDYSYLIAQTLKTKKAVNNKCLNQTNIVNNVRVKPNCLYKNLKAIFAGK